jgi:hypothetical protein
MSDERWLAQERQQPEPRWLVGFLGASNHLRRGARSIAVRSTTKSQTGGRFFSFNLKARGTALCCIHAPASDKQ